MQFFKSSIITILLIFTISCKKELPFPDVDAETLLTANSFFSPESMLQVHVSESCHINDTLCSFNFIPNAEVLLKDQTGNVLATLQHQSNGIYSPDNLNLNHEANYQLEIEHSTKKLTAESQIPKTFSCIYLGKEEGVFDGYAAWRFDIEINDNPDEENYYLLEGYIEILDGEHEYSDNTVNGYLLPQTAHLTNDVNTENNSISSGVDFITYPLRSIYLPDKNFNGQTYRTHFALYDDDIYFPEFEEFKAHLFVKSVSKEMYEYYKSLDLYRLSQSNLFAEPQQIYSNITGGIGIFAGYTQQHFEIDLPVSEYRLPNDIFVENEGCTSPCTVKFTTDGGSKLNYNWDFGDGNSSSEISPEHNYDLPGNYIVEMSVSNEPGNIYSFTVEVTVN